jgi:hypothetical protein
VQPFAIFEGIVKGFLEKSGIKNSDEKFVQENRQGFFMILKGNCPHISCK